MEKWKKRVCEKLEGSVVTGGGAARGIGMMLVQDGTIQDVGLAASAVPDRNILQFRRRFLSNPLNPHFLRSTKFSIPPSISLTPPPRIYEQWLSGSKILTNQIRYALLTLEQMV